MAAEGVSAAHQNVVVAAAAASWHGGSGARKESLSGRMAKRRQRLAGKERRQRGKAAKRSVYRAYMQALKGVVAKTSVKVEMPANRHGSGWRHARRQ